MDIISHAVAGGAVGFALGRPVLGVVFGVLPDISLATYKRLKHPTVAYNAAHSATAVLVVGVAAGVLTVSAVPLLALLSHILLDMPTHGKTWAPPLLYPFSDKRFSYGEEWEWFNPSWYEGLLLTIFWSLLWIIVSFT